MNINQNAVEGCLRAKHFYSLAIEHSTSRHPFGGGVTVSHLQDAVEALAYTIAVDIGAAIGQAPTFHKFWEDIAKTAAPKRLPYQAEMGEINHARVGFKHKGVQVSEQSVQKFLRNSHRFLTESAELFLGIDFDNLSEAELIADEKLRAIVKAAVDHLNRGEFDDTLKRCRDAVEILDNLLRLTVPQSRVAAPRAHSDAASLMVWAEAKFTAIERTIALTTIGIEPTDYWLLKSVLPMKSRGGTYQFTQVGMAPQINASTTAEAVRILTRLALNLEAASHRLQIRTKAFMERQPLKPQE